MSIASDAISLSASALSLANSTTAKPQKSDDESVIYHKRYKPVWHECLDVIVDLTQVKAIQSWHYLVKSNIPRGVRFRLIDGSSISTKEMSSSEVDYLLSRAKSCLQMCDYEEM